MTLHKTVTGWRVNAGCVSFDATTIDGVCEMVRENVRNGPDEWADQDKTTRELWGRQVLAALDYLASMVQD